MKWVCAKKLRMQKKTNSSARFCEPVAAATARYTTGVAKKKANVPTAEQVAISRRAPERSRRQATTLAVVVQVAMATTTR